MLWTLRVFSKGSTVEGPFGPQQSSQSVRILSPPKASSFLLTPGQSGSRRSPPGSPGSVQAAARDPASCKPSASADSPHPRPRVTNPAYQEAAALRGRSAASFRSRRKMVMAKSRLVGRALKRLRAPVTDLIATGQHVSLVWDPPRRFARRDPRRTRSTASPRRSGQAVPLRRMARQSAPITRHVGQKILG